LVSASQIKLVRSLRQNKYRDIHNLFVAEGDKIVLELLKNQETEATGSGNIPGVLSVRQLFATGKWLETHRNELEGGSIPLTKASTSEIRKLSSLVTPQQVIALVNKPAPSKDPEELAGIMSQAGEQAPAGEKTPAGEILPVFESVRDPGNLGTIIRTADWFGICHIVCSPDSVDVFNPKVVQSTMGAIARVRVHYLEILDLLGKPFLKERPKYGTFLDGESIYKTRLDPQPVILFGNESRGITGSYESCMDKKIAIPSYSAVGGGSESLNLASAVAIVCSEIRRRGL